MTTNAHVPKLRLVSSKREEQGMQGPREPAPQEPDDKAVLLRERAADEEATNGRLPEAALRASSDLEGVCQALQAWRKEVTDCLRAFPEHSWHEITDLTCNRLISHFAFLKGEQADADGMHCRSPKQYVLKTVHGCGLEVGRKHKRRHDVLRQLRELTRGWYTTHYEGLDLQRAIQRLSSTDQTLVLLTKLKGKSVRDAAEELGIPEHVARHRLNKALTSLRKFLGE